MRGLALLLVASALLVSGLILGGCATRGYVAYGAGPVVYASTPAANVWVDGYWFWNGFDYVWINGHYAPPARAGFAYVYYGGGYRLVPQRYVVRGYPYVRPHHVVVRPPRGYHPHPGYGYHPGRPRAGHPHPGHGGVVVRPPHSRPGHGGVVVRPPQGGVVARPPQGGVVVRPHRGSVRAAPPGRGGVRVR